MNTRFKRFHRPYLWLKALSIKFWYHHKLRRLTQPLVVLIVCSMVLPQLAWAFDQINYSVPENSVKLHNQIFSIPKKIGKLVEAYQAQPPTVIVIQDLHCHAEVQHNIANLIHHLVEKNNTILVGVEGSHGQLDVSKLRDFPLSEVKESVGRYFVRQGKMNGAEYYAVTGKQPIILEGIETDELYQSSLSTVASFLTDEIQGSIYDLRDAMHAIKSSHYNEQLNNHDHAVQAYREGKWPLIKYAAYLYKKGLEQQVKVDEFKLVKKYVSKRRQVLGLTFDQEALFQQLDQLELAIRRPLYQTDHEEKIDELIGRLNLIDKLLNVSVSPQELKLFQQQSADYQIHYIIDFIKAANRGSSHSSQEFIFDESNQIDSALEKVNDFYQQADQRSEAFVTNLIQKMKEHDQQQAILIGGGFHTIKVLAELKKQQLSYINIKPNITQLDLINPYFSLLRSEKTALEKLLAKTQNTIGLASLFPSKTLAASVPKRAWPEELKIFDDRLELAVESDTLSLGLAKGRLKINDLKKFVESTLANDPHNGEAIRFDWTRPQVIGNSDRKTYVIPVMVNGNNMTAVFNIGATSNLKESINKRQTFNINLQLLDQEINALQLDQIQNQRRISILSYLNPSTILALLGKTFYLVEQWWKNNRISSINPDTAAPAGRWPGLQPFYDMNEILLGGREKGVSSFRSGLAWLTAQAILPALVESLLMVGGTQLIIMLLFDLPFGFDQPFWIIYGSLKLFWHGPHYSGWMKIKSWKQFQQALSNVFTRPTIAITSITTLALVAIDYYFHPIGWAFSGYYLVVLLVAHIAVDGAPLGFKIIKKLKLKIENNRTMELDNGFSMPGFWIAKILFEGDLDRQVNWGKRTTNIIDIIIIALLASLLIINTSPGLSEMSLAIFAYALMLQLLKGFSIISFRMKSNGWDIYYFFSGLIRQLFLLFPYIPAYWLWLHSSFPLINLISLGALYFILKDYNIRSTRFLSELYRAQHYKKIDVNEKTKYDNPSWRKVNQALGQVDPRIRELILVEMDKITRKHMITANDFEGIDLASLSKNEFNQLWPESVDHKVTQAADEMNALFGEHARKHLADMPKELQAYFWVGMLYNHTYYAEYDPTNPAKNFTTFMHSHALSEYTAETATYYNEVNAVSINDENRIGPEEARILAWTHDYGKNLIDPAVVRFNGRFDLIQRAVVQCHSRAGYQVLKQLNNYLEIIADPGLDPNKVIEIHEGCIHHEHIDGSGYPWGLKKAQMKFIHRLFKVVDVYESMTASNRSFYRKRDKIHYAIIFEFIKWAVVNHELDIKWVEAFRHVSKMSPKKYDVRIFIQPPGYDENTNQRSTEERFDEMFYFGKIGQRPPNASMLEAQYGHRLAIANEEPRLATELASKRELLTGENVLTLINDMMWILGSSTIYSTQKLNQFAIKMLGFVDDPEQPQLLIHVALYVLRSLKKKVNRTIQAKITKILTSRSRFNLLDVITQPGQLDRVRQFLTSDKGLALPLLTGEGQGINISIVGWSSEDPARLAADLDRFNKAGKKHDVIVADVMIPHMIIKDFRDDKSIGFAYFAKDGTLMSAFKDTRLPETDPAKIKKFLKLYKRYNTLEVQQRIKDGEASSRKAVLDLEQPAGLEVDKGVFIEIDPYEEAAKRYGLSLKERAFSKGIRSHIKVALNILGTYPGEEEEILTVMAEDVPEEGLIITGNPLVPDKYNKSDAQFTVYQKRDGQLKPHTLYLIRDKVRYGFSIQDKSIQEAEWLGHAIISAMKNGDRFEQVGALGFNLNEVEQVSLDRPAYIDLIHWENTVKERFKERSAVKSTSELKNEVVDIKKGDSEKKRKGSDDDSDNDPPGPGISGAPPTGGSPKIARQSSGVHFENDSDQANRPFYPRVAAIQKLFHQLLQFIFFTPDGTALRVGYRLPLQAFSIIFGAPLLIIRLVLAVIANQSLKQPIKIDSNHPQLQRLLRENNLPDQLSVAYLTKEGLQLPTISIQPLSVLKSNGLSNWYGNYMSAGEVIAGKVQERDTLYLPDLLLATVVEGADNYPAFSWQGAWKTANYTGARALLSLFIGHMRRNRDELLRVDLLINALDQPLAKPWSTQVETVISGVIHAIQWLPKTWQRPLHQRLRKINAPSYLKIILNDQQSPLTQILSQGHHPLGKAYRVWSTVAGRQTKAGFLEQLDQVVEQQWARLDQRIIQGDLTAESELIIFLKTLSNLAKLLPEIEGNQVGQWQHTNNARSGRSIYLPISILGKTRYEQGKLLDRLKRLPAIKIDENRFKHYYRDNQQKRHDIAA